MKCSVKNCKNVKKFKFPLNVSLKKTWLEAIRRPDFVPGPNQGLCIEHFSEKDIVTESYRDGYKLKVIRLKLGTVPTIFPWQKETNENMLAKKVHTENSTLNGSGEKFVIVAEPEQSVNCELMEVAHRDENSEENIIEPHSVNLSNDAIEDSDVVNCHVHVYEEEINSDFVDINLSSNYNSPENIKNHCVEIKQTISTQTDNFSRYNIDDFKEKSKVLLHLTGLENYGKFMTVFYSLGPAVHNLKYIRSTVGNVSVTNHLFLVLWKLRRYPSDIELAEHFNVPEIAVGNIFITWIQFMSKTWSLIDLWSSRELIDFYMSEIFTQNYPCTRVIVDGTEIKTEASSNPRLKQSSFSTYKNTTTMKILVGGSPGGLISYVSPAYGGSTSDRQIIERSDLMKKCITGDIIMGDKGFMIQDLFAPYNVTVATPTPLVSGSLPYKTIMKDRKLSKHRVHIERVIGLLKTFTILSKKLNHYYLPLTSEIVGVCIMLTNFKENIMKVQC